MDQLILLITAVVFLVLGYYFGYNSKGPNIIEKAIKEVKKPTDIEDDGKGFYDR